MIIINPVAPLAIYSEKASDIYRFFGFFFIFKIDDLIWII